MIKEKERDMGKSKVTIKEIADKAGVSIATVSHVINRTRYVRPELVDKIEKIIVETGYQNKIADKERKLLVGRESTIVAVIPNIESTIYRDMVAYVEQLVSVQGYQFLVAITDNDFKEETQLLYPDAFLSFWETRSFSVQAFWLLLFFLQEISFHLSLVLPGTSPLPLSDP